MGPQSTTEYQFLRYFKTLCYQLSWYVTYKKNQKDQHRVKKLPAQAKESFESDWVLLFLWYDLKLEFENTPTDLEFYLESAGWESFFLILGGGDLLLGKPSGSCVPDKPYMYREYTFKMAVNCKASFSIIQLLLLFVNREWMEMGNR